MRYHLQDYWLVYVLISALLMLIAFVIHIDGIQQQKWQKFAASHDCRIVERMNGDAMTTIAPIIGGNGGVAIGTTSTPDKVAYLCNDGVKSNWSDWCAECEKRGFNGLYQTSGAVKAAPLHCGTVNIS